jgi:septin family protein
MSNLWSFNFSPVDNLQHSDFLLLEAVLLHGMLRMRATTEKRFLRFRRSQLKLRDENLRATQEMIGAQVRRQVYRVSHILYAFLLYQLRQLPLAKHLHTLYVLYIYVECIGIYFPLYCNIARGRAWAQSMVL